MTTAGAGIELGPRTVSLSHSAAGPSDLSRVANPQLGPQPWFAYPSPTSTQLEEELPPYWDAESIPLGHLLDRLSRKGYGDMGTLLQQTWVIS
jgi:mediator of RNA polymerase II transcription subunit 14